MIAAEVIPITSPTKPSLVLLFYYAQIVAYVKVGLNTKNTHDRIHSETVAFSKQKMKRLTLSSKPSVSSSWHDPGFSQNCTTQTRAGNKKV